MTEHARDRRAFVTNCISGTAYLSVQGPGSRELLAPLAEADLSTDRLPYFRCVRTVVADVPTLVSRTGYSGELGYELYYPRDYALHMWDTLTNAGATPCGLGALRSVRMEKKYPLYGLDVSETTSPLEAGLGWAVDLDGSDFMGRDALMRQRDEGIARLLTGIEFPDLSFVPSAGDAVATADGEPLGTLTSADRGWFLGKALAMGYLPFDLARFHRHGDLGRRHPGRGRDFGSTVLRPGRNARPRLGCLAMSAWNVLGRRALVTGGNRGIGLEVVRLLGPHWLGGLPRLARSGRGGDRRLGARIAGCHTGSHRRSRPLERDGRSRFTGAGRYRRAGQQRRGQPTRSGDAGGGRPGLAGEHAGVLARDTGVPDADA